jgi:hypothetical protein
MHDREQKDPSLSSTLPKYPAQSFQLIVPKPHGDLLALACFDRSFFSLHDDFMRRSRLFFSPLCAGSGPASNTEGNEQDYKTNSCGSCWQSIYRVNHGSNDVNDSPKT